MRFSNIEELKSTFTKLGCKVLYVKRMSPNDNSKNQIYMGGDFSSLNLFPINKIELDRSSKAGSKRERLKTTFSFGWITEGDLSYDLVNLILYPKYPEVRLSGLLKSRKASPEVSQLINSRAEGRLLYLGVTDDGRVMGHCSAKSDPLTSSAENYISSGSVEQNGVFATLGLGYSSSNPVDVIETALRPIIQSGWLASERLNKAGLRIPCNSPNCGGYTLEAALGVIPNGISVPDYKGWEVKQYGVSKFTSKASKAITLMTPEPDGGLYKELGVIDFLKKYGYADRSNPRDRLNFGGVHKVGAICAKTKMSLNLFGYDISSPKKWNADGSIQLIEGLEVAASWSFAGLLEHWKRKHAKAVYVKSIKRSEPKIEYRYCQNIEIGIGTDFVKFLSALANQSIYYDPGIRMNGLESKKYRTKRRSQFRVKSSELNTLYSTYDHLNVLRDH